MLFALLQEKKADLADDAQKVARGVADGPLTIFTGLREFLQDVYEYIRGPDFIGNILASLLVGFLGILIFRVLTRGVPRVLQWRRSNREALLDVEAVARIKRQDTAITSWCW
jgi:small conductance mechanosensitive channel